MTEKQFLMIVSFHKSVMQAGTNNDSDYSKNTHMVTFNDNFEVQSTVLHFVAATRDLSSYDRPYTNKSIKNSCVQLALLAARSVQGEGIT